MNFRAKI